MARWGFWDCIAYSCLGIAALGLAVGAAMKDHPTLWDRLPTIVFDTRWAYAPIILFALGTMILAIQYVAPLIVKSSTTTAAESSIQKTNRKTTGSATTRHIVDVKPEYLLSLYNEHTTAQGDLLAQPYLGKWIKYSGATTNVHKHPDGDGGTLVGRIADYNQLYMDFSKEWIDRIIVLRRGQNVSVIGQVTRITSSQVELQNCELIETAQ
jgi:hypothetical protein